MTTQNQLLREALEAYRAAREMPSYGDYASINWQSQQGPTNPAFGGGDCAKHGRWYGHCHCCADDWEKLRKQADRDAVHARDNALRKADELARAALAQPAEGLEVVTTIRVVDETGHGAKDWEFVGVNGIYELPVGEHKLYTTPPASQPGAAMSASAQMQFLGEDDGVRWYWAEPGLFQKPGVYYWNGSENVHVGK